MFPSQPSEVSLEAPCRCVTALKADRTESRFVAGTWSPHSDNQLALLHYHAEDNDLTLAARLPHEAGPIKAIETSPMDRSLVLTVPDESTEAIVWRLSMTLWDDDDDATETMEEMERLSSTNVISDVAWRDGSEEPSSGDVAVVDRQGSVSRWDVEVGTATSVRTDASSSNTIKRHPSFEPRLSWDPHHPDALAVSRNNTQIAILDWRTDTSIPTGTCDHWRAHRFAVTDLDYNPNKPYVLTSCGEDGLVQFWDTRQTRRPTLAAKGGHSHWVTSVQYNPFHDQLVLSTGTDSLANLWRPSSISSAPLLTLADQGAPDVKVTSYDQGESIYAAAWSASDAWMYLTLSFDGRAVLQHVPSKEKYKILL